MKGPLAVALIGEPVAPCNAGCYSLQASPPDQQAASPFRKLSEDNLDGPLREWVNQMLTDRETMDTVTAGQDEDLVTKQRRIYDMAPWSRIPINQALPTNNREMIQRLLAWGIVAILHLFPPDRPSLRQAYPKDLTDEQIKDFMGEGALGWAILGSDQPGNATARGASNPKARTVTLPCSIMMTPTAPEFYEREINGVTLRIPKAMVVWLHHCFGADHQ